MTEFGQPAAPSPCVNACVLDAGGICLGCGRSIHDIAQWSTAPAAARCEILRVARERLARQAACPAPRGEDFGSDDPVRS